MINQSVGVVETKYYTIGKNILLESGEEFGPITVAYETYGRLNGKKDNAVFLDTATLEYEYAPIKLENAKIVIAYCWMNWKKPIRMYSISCCRSWMTAASPTPRAGTSALKTPL